MVTFTQIGVLGGIVALDQVTKFYAGQQGWVGLNPGISFGLLGNSSSFLVSCLITLVLSGMGWWIYREGKKTPFAAALVLGGGLSNLIDRWWWGGVRDWLPVPGLQLHNNLADCAIVGGLLCILWQTYHHDKHSHSL